MCVYELNFVAFQCGQSVARMYTLATLKSDKILSLLLIEPEAQGLFFVSFYQKSVSKH